jgi:hypothetical protein
MNRRLSLTREQVLAFRRLVGSLDTRLPFGAAALRVAAWAGLQDSMPRAALLSIHARVSDASSDAWAHESLIQVWGPRYSAFVVAAEDLPIFTLGRYPDDARGQARAENAATSVENFLKTSRMSYGTAGSALGVNPNSLRYGATTGRIAMRWEGARAPQIWALPAPTISPQEARLELARRYLHVYGPATARSFGTWAGIPERSARKAFDDLRAELTEVRTPIGDAWILSSDEPAVGSSTKSAGRMLVRLLPSGDAYFLLQGRDRELLVPDSHRRGELWTSRVWPGAMLIDGEIAGVWRRANEKVTVDMWRNLAAAERTAVEAEASTMPLPGLTRPISVTWQSEAR